MGQHHFQGITVVNLIIAFMTIFRYVLGEHGFNLAEILKLIKTAHHNGLVC